FASPPAAAGRCRKPEWPARIVAETRCPRQGGVFAARARAADRPRWLRSLLRQRASGGRWPSSPRSEGGWQQAGLVLPPPRCETVVDRGGRALGQYVLSGCP